MGSEGFGGGAAAEVDIVCFEERNLTEGVGAVYKGMGIHGRVARIYVVRGCMY